MGRCGSTQYTTLTLFVAATPNVARMREMERAFGITDFGDLLRVSPSGLSAPSAIYWSAW